MCVAANASTAELSNLKNKSQMHQTQSLNFQAGYWFLEFQMNSATTCFLSGRITAGTKTNLENRNADRPGLVRGVCSKE